jgi:hypothetical protein
MIYVGLYGYKWFLGKYIVGVGLLTYSHMFLNGSILATPVYIYTIFYMFKIMKRELYFLSK